MRRVPDRRPIADLQLPSWDFVGPARTLTAERPRRDSRAPAAPRQADVQQRLDRVLALDRHERALQEGRVDPVLFEIRRDAEALFRPDWELTRNDPHGLGSVGNSLVELLRVLGQQYLDTLKRQREMRRSVDGLRPDEEPTVTEVFNDLVHGARRPGRGVGLSCEVCIDLGPDAADRSGPSPVRVTRRSGRPAFDRLARRALDRARRLRRPRLERGPTRICYRFEATFHRFPPLPIIGGTFDESSLSGELFYPLKKILRSRVVLVSAR